MKSFGSYISKYLASFIVFILLLAVINAGIFGAAFYQTFTEDYGETSPRAMLERTAQSITPSGMAQEARQALRFNHIWALYLNQDGQCFWSLDAPDEVPQSYTIQDVALFSKGYIAGYPVFVWNTDDGVLVLGYPKDSYTKLTGNYYPIELIKRLPVFAAGMLAMDLLLIFSAYYVSKRTIIKNIGPIAAALETLAEGKPISLHIRGELSEVAQRINKASRLLSRQNEARANWISGVSHDIRTPLSMIMGYALRIAGDQSAGSLIREQAEIVHRQSIKIKELVEDLNLVSQLEYEMRPIRKETVRLSKLIRSCAAELLNTGIPRGYTMDMEIDPGAETSVLACDARLIARSINNLVQNSIGHNPQGCRVKLLLEKKENALLLTVEDDGIGLSREKLKELAEKPHYMESVDERLDLRHGLGLLIVKETAKIHHGAMEIKNAEGGGCKVVLSFPL